MPLLSSSQYGFDLVIIGSSVKLGLRDRGMLISLMTRWSVLGRTEAECKLKMRILDIIKNFMGLEVSAKQDISVYKEVFFVGLVWSVAGITIGDAGVSYVLSCLEKIPIGVKQARMVRGVLVQAKSAFKFSPAELLRFGELLATITACIVDGESRHSPETSRHTFSHFGPSQHSLRLLRETSLG